MKRLLVSCSAILYKEFYYILKNSLSLEELNSMCSFRKYPTQLIFQGCHFCCHVIVYIPIDEEAPKEQDGAYWKFSTTNCGQVMAFLASGVSKKDEQEFLLFLQCSLRMASFIRFVWHCDQFNRNWMVSKMMLKVLV